MTVHLPLIVGAGSQEGEAAEYLPMPHEMATFRMPAVSRPGSGEATAEACTILGALLAEMKAWRFGTGEQPLFVLTGLAARNPGALALINESLGQGEVSAVIDGPTRIAIQETAFASIWRVQHLDGKGAVLSDTLEVGPIPEAVRERAMASARPAEVVEIGAPPEGHMNSPSILHELVSASARFRPGQPAHVVNLTLLPVTPEDHLHLEATLGTGATTILSRGYGNCRISATALSNVWWVRYFNSMDTLILDTIEVVDVPQAALAAREDFEDSTERLDQLLSILAEPEA